MPLPQQLTVDRGSCRIAAMMSQLLAQSACAPCTSVRSSKSLRGQQLHTVSRTRVQSVSKQIVATTKASGDTKQKPKNEPSDKEQQGSFQPPALDPSTPSPIFGGSTGGLLRMAQVCVETELQLHFAARTQAVALSIVFAVFRLRSST